MRDITKYTDSLIGVVLVAAIVAYTGEMWTWVFDIELTQGITLELLVLGHGFFLWTALKRKGK